MEVIAHILAYLITGIVLVAIGLGVLTLVLMYIYWIIDDMKAIFGK